MRIEDKVKPVVVIEKLNAFLQEQGVKKVVVGISGGKDSTIVAKLMSECLGKQNVIGVLMPNGEQSDIDVSYKVVKYLGIPYINVNIGEGCKALTEDIIRGLAAIAGSYSESAKINLPPRLRMSVLYAVAQSIGSGCRVVGTTNRSEEFVGWLTKWGDGACDFEPIIDYTVTELRELGTNLGIPDEFVHKVPIDGLTDGTDEERLGFSYAQLDKYIMTGTSGNETIDKMIAKMHEYSEHKRNLIPKCNFGPFANNRT